MNWFWWFLRDIGALVFVAMGLCQPSSMPFLSKTVGGKLPGSLGLRSLRPLALWQTLVPSRFGIATGATVKCSAPTSAECVQPGPKTPAVKQCLFFIAASGMCVVASFSAAFAQVKSDTGSIAIGGSVTASTITIGISQQKVDELVRDAKRPLEELTAQQRDNIVLLKDKLDLNIRQVQAALTILGENDIPPERLATKLVEIALRFRDFQATAARPADDPKIAALNTNVGKAVESGQIVEADALLANVEMEQRRRLERLAVDAAETSARRGDLALARLRYGEAARYFANAAALFPSNGGDGDKRISYLQKEAGALYQQGDELGDNDALFSAIERYQRLVRLTPRERMPQQWASTQNDLGNVLLSLGQRESGVTRLEQAITAYFDALKEWTEDRAPSIGQ
jgi:tetratricopeptide (TPR) repeat protein